MTPLPWFGGFAVYAAGATAVAGLSPAWRGRLGIGIAAMLLPLPLVVGSTPFARAALAIVLVMLLLRAIDLGDEPRLATFGARLRHLVLIVDTRVATSRARRVERAVVEHLIVDIAAIVALALALRVGRPLEYLVGGLLVFASVDFLATFFRLVTDAVGLELPAMMNAPHRSTTLMEFWSKRWNRVISEILRERFFVPMGRRPLRALAAAFVASAAIHGYLVAVSVGWRGALPMSAFFLAQVPLIVVERRIGVRRWHPVPGWLWTFTLLAVLSPLLIQPALPILQSLVVAR